MTNNKTFYRISNKEIYKEILDTKRHVLSIKGKVKLNKWIATTALLIGLTLAGIKIL